MTKKMVPQTGPDMDAVGGQPPWPTERRPRFRTPVGEKSKTKQSMAEDCDINLIISRHAQTGQISHLNPKAPQFGDFTHPMDLKQAIDAVNDARARFGELPSDVRSAAANDPVQFLAMLEDENGTRELEAAGLILTDQPVPQVPPEKETAPRDPPQKDDVSEEQKRRSTD